MPKKQKKYKVESKSLTKKLNLPADKLAEKIKGLTPAKVNQILANLDKADFDFQYAKLPAAVKQYVDLNKGNPAPRKPGVFRGAEPFTEKIPNVTPEQSQAMNFLLQRSLPEAFINEKATPEQIATARKQGLGGVLEELGQKDLGPLGAQLEAMFGHMQNPILQGILNPALGNDVQVLFPSQLQGHNKGIENLLAQLAVPLAQAGIANAPAALEYLQAHGPEAYQYLKAGAQGIGNYVGQSRPVQQGREYAEAILGIPGLAREAKQAIGESFTNPELYGGIPAGAYQGAQDLYGFAKTLPGEAYKDVSSLLSTLGSYIPRRKQ